MTWCLFITPICGDLGRLCIIRLFGLPQVFITLLLHLDVFITYTVYDVHVESMQGMPLVPADCQILWVNLECYWVNVAFFSAITELLYVVWHIYVLHAFWMDSACIPDSQLLASWRGLASMIHCCLAGLANDFTLNANSPCCFQHMRNLIQLLCTCNSVL
jgi:hypothetical protein